jgi:hypothetical protein
MARPLTPAATDIDLRAVWRVTTPRIEADAVDFWERLGLLPPDVDPAERARQLAAVAYRDGALIGVMTAALERVEPVRARLAMIRAAVDPEHRRTHVVMALLLATRSTIERWSQAHPEERIAGLGAVIESGELAERQRQPFWPQSRLGLAGYTADGRQFRISWFDDFVLDQ